MRTVARTGTALLALGAAALVLTACGDDEPSAADVADVVAAAGEDGGAGAAGTAEEGSAAPGDADLCALYAADGQAFVDAYDYVGSGATDDVSELVAAADALAADIDAVPADEVSDALLGTAEEISASAAEVGPALEAGEGVEEIDATIGGLETLADTCAELGLA
ncbi:MULTISPECIES: hypothetical protein [unclassified Blastococcus]